MRLAVLLIALAAVPATAQVAVQSRLVHDHHVVPGEEVEGSVTVLNAGTTPRVARLSLADYSFASDGTTQYSPPGTSPRSAAGWVSLGAPEVVVPAQASTEVRYRIRVPEAPRAGTWWSVLLVEDAGPADGVPTERGVRVTIRFAVQLALRFEGGAPGLDIQDLALSQEGGRDLLRLDLANEGSALADTELTLDLFAPDGRARGRYDGSRVRLYPGTSAVLAVDLTSVPPGRYSALAVVETSDGEGVGTQFTLDL